MAQALNGSMHVIAINMARTPKRRKRLTCQRYNKLGSGRPEYALHVEIDEQVVTTSPEQIYNPSTSVKLEVVWHACLSLLPLVGEEVCGSPKAMGEESERVAVVCYILSAAVGGRGR